MSEVSEERFLEDPPPVPADPPAPARAPQAKPSQVTAQANREEEMDILSWFKSIGGDGIGDVRVMLYRAHPEKHPVKWPDGRTRDFPIKGHQFTYDELVDEDRIRADFGGGTYDVRVHKRNEKGSFVNWRGKRVFVGGNPNPKKLLEQDQDWMDAMAEAGNASRRQPEREREDSSVVGQAITTMKELVKDEREQRKSGAGSSMDVENIVKAAQAPLLETLKEMRADAKEARMDRQPPPQSKALEQLFEKALDGQDTRLMALRTQFDSERNQLNVYWQGQVERSRDDATRQIAAAEKSHDREMKNLEKSHEVALSSMKQSYEARIDALKESIKRLEREIETANKELATLRGTKNQTTLEKLEEVEQFRDFFQKDDDDEKKDGLGQAAEIITALGNTEVAKAIGSRLAGGSQPQQQPGQQQMVQQQDPFAHVPVNVAFRYKGQLPNGQMYDGVLMKMPNGQIMPVRRREKPAAGAKPAGPGPQGVTPPGAEGEVAAAAPVEEPINVDPADLKKAMTFIEGALGSRTEPEQFAATVRISGMMPPAIIGILRRHGVQRLIEVANPDDSSPILTIRGKQWLAKVAEILIQ